MKKIFFTILVAFVAMGVGAQTKPLYKVTWGTQISLGYIHVSNSDDLDNWYGASLGVSGKYQASREFGVKAALQWLYCQSPKEDVFGVKAQVRASYFELPVLACYDISKDFGIQLGIKPAIQTSFKVHCDAPGILAWSEEFENTNKFQLYIPVGLTYQFDSPLSVGLHYNFPVTRINKEKDDDGDGRFHQFLLTFNWEL